MFASLTGEHHTPNRENISLRVNSKLSGSSKYSSSIVGALVGL